jgi:hypothetical protein
VEDDMDLEEFKARFAPYVDDGDEAQLEWEL